jgi:hypothetical protein
MHTLAVPACFVLHDDVAASARCWNALHLIDYIHDQEIR